MTPVLARMAANLGFQTWVLGDAMATFARRTPDGEPIGYCALLF